MDPKPRGPLFRHGPGERFPHCSRRVHACAGQTLEELVTAGQPGHWRDRMQRNFEPMRRQVEQWRDQQLSMAAAKLIIYRAFVEGELNAPKHLAGVVHDLYFNPKYDEFQPRTMWSLSNAFTSAFKELDPIPQFKATAKLGRFYRQRPLYLLRPQPSEYRDRPTGRIG
jgi:hypothetical protein